MRMNNKKHPKSCFDETLYVPFENTVIPVPAGYDIILRRYYGNYMVPVHEKIITKIGLSLIRTGPIKSI